MKLLATTAVALAALALPAAATTVQVTITNNSDTNGLFFTPFLNVFHSGDYDPFNGGEAASAGLEELAELGSTGTAAAEAEAMGRIIETLTEPTGVGPAVGAPPVFDPGNSATFTLDLDSTENMYLTLLSMIIPSNDTFISDTIRLFDTNGDFIAASYDLGRSNVYDAGTEVNRQDGFGQAFNTADGNGPGALGEDENGLVHLSSDAELLTLFDQPIPPLGGGLNIGDLASFEDVITISFEEIAPVPLPASGWVLLAGIGGMGALARRKKKAQKAA
ncbi:MAG: spondin domain-containing protein [Roseobacter sp.]